MLRGAGLSIVLVATALGLSAPVAAQSGASAAAQDAPEEPAPSPSGAVIVVVETARRAIGPQAIRSAIGERLAGATVRGLSDREGPIRAWVAVAVHGDGSADVRVVSQNGNEDTAHVETDADLAPATAIAERIATLLGAAEADPPIGSVARHGLIPWEEEGLRAYPAERRFHRIDGESLLPWPRPGEARGERTRSRGVERAAGLSAPPPRRAQNR